MAKKTPAAAPAPKKLALETTAAGVKLLHDVLTRVVRNPGTPESTDRPLALHGPLARSRNVALRAIAAKVEEAEAARVAILRAHAEKGDDGEPKVVNGRFEIPQTEFEAIKEEYEAVVSAPVSVPIPNVDRPHWGAVRTMVVRDCRYEMDEAMGALYDELCASLEALAL